MSKEAPGNDPWETRLCDTLETFENPRFAACFPDLSVRELWEQADSMTRESASDLRKQENLGPFGRDF